MVSVGIEAINVYAGTACVDVRELASHRQLDLARFDNLLMREKTVALPNEDPVTFAVNAARPLVDALTAAEKDRIEMVITCTESSFDFGKSLSTYVHQLLDLNRNCRLFELKNACYSGVAGLQMAVNFIVAQTSPGARVLVVATDISRFLVEEDGAAQDWSFAEPSGGAGAVAMLVGEQPAVFRIDVGANGYYGYEVMDTCRPSADSEAGDADLSLLSYLDCCEKAYLEYQKRVPQADYARSFGYLAFHTPFGGMIKGAHRSMMRKLARAPLGPQDIEADFSQRVAPGLDYCQRVGNTMGAAAMVSLLSTIDNGCFDTPQRVGCFSYGSGCCSEFFSGVATREGQARVRAMDIRARLDQRYRLSMDEYEDILARGSAVRFGTRNVTLAHNYVAAAPAASNATLYLRAIRDYHREYAWAA
ncbi:MAG: hydroxymethylglutaryl-CoA synthase family protein [Duganella sp.]